MPLSFTPEKARSQGRFVGIDFGLKRIGLAVSDQNCLIANPLGTIHAEDKSEQTIQKILSLLHDLEGTQQYAYRGIVVGMPLMMNGKRGFLADEVQHFTELLRKLCPLPVVTWDERLTSVQADRSLRQGHMTRKQRSTKVDTLSAVIILQSYLDYWQEMASMEKM